MHGVVITGLGAITPVGQNAQSAFEALVAGQSGIDRADVPGLGPESTMVAGQIAFDVATWWSLHQAAQFDRSVQFALIASSQAIADAQLELSEEESHRAGVYWGTGLGGATSIEESYRQLYGTPNGRVRPSSVVLGMSNGAAGHISMANGLRGPLVNISNACSSSAVSIGEAARAIHDGYAEVIVAGGSEALITLGNLRAWDAMRALAHASDIPAESCKPFARDRAGLVLGEGAAAIVLESAERAERRGARIYGELVGYGNASDASSISKPDVDGQVRAMRRALVDAHVNEHDVGYINAHGTATPVGDFVETNAIKSALGSHANRVMISSTKALHGHLMGATGALEIMVAVMALHAGVIPPTAHLVHPDPQCDLDYVPITAREARVQAVMSNSFGFGGTNAVLVARPYRSIP